MRKPKYKMATLYFTHIPLDLKNHFKAYCAKRGRTMKEVVVAFMQEKAKEG